jgi:hypothetical protein
VASGLEMEQNNAQMSFGPSVQGASIVP